MRKDNYFFLCLSCQRKTNEKETTSRCLSCGGPLEVVYDYDSLKKEVNFYFLRHTTPKVMKYLDFYPLHQKEKLYSLDEGGTSLLRAKNLAKVLGIKNLLVKNEGLNPTGAFKDRGSFLEINKAKELGYKSVCVASTGNMAASVSAYSVQAGLECFVFVPEGTPKGKLAQCLSYGAKVIQVKGTYSEANFLAEKTAEKYGFYLAGDYVFRGEGQKSAGFELAEQMWQEKIDWVIVPVGMGTNLSAIWKGFWEYYRLGLIQALPKMVAVQSQGCHSIFEKKGKYTLRPVEKPQTVCSAIAVGYPLDGLKVIRALKNSGGKLVVVSDEEALSAQQLLAHTEALYIEPSSATTIAALQKLLQAGLIKENETVASLATGAGLKDPATTLKVLAEPPTIEPNLKEVERVIKGKFFAIQAAVSPDREKILFRQLPSQKEIKESVEKIFSLRFSSQDLVNLSKKLREFIQNKGKAVSKADLQAILETLIQQESRKKYLQISDFYIEDSLGKRPKAKVELFLYGKKYKAESEGVGPVDAAISAIAKILRKYDGINFQLTDFNVEIPTSGSDATVEVTMVLREKTGTYVVEKGTSPDIIEASIEAFVKGYNELVYQLKEKNKKGGENEKRRN